MARSFEVANCICVAADVAGDSANPFSRTPEAVQGAARPIGADADNVLRAWGLGAEDCTN